MTVTPSLPHQDSGSDTGLAQMRAEFEKWAVKFGMPIEHHPTAPSTHYKERDTTFAWIGWQGVMARRPSPAAPAAEDGKISESERWTIDRAADFLEHYAQYIASPAVKVEDIEAHPYLPELQYVAGQLRDWFRHRDARHAAAELVKKQEVDRG